MRLTFLFIAGACLVGCGNSNTTADMMTGGTVDMAVVVAGGDMATKPVTPYNNTTMIDCYTGPKCVVGSASPVCCDASGADGGFSDTCTTTAACLASDSKAKTFECGQAANCGAGMICCGVTGMSSSGKPFIDSSACAATCPSGSTQLCVSATECTATGVSCVGKDVSGRDIGLCQ